MSGPFSNRFPIAAAAMAMLLAFGLMPSAASAQGLPPGPWREVCDNARINNGVLSAECPRSGPQSRRYDVDLRRCPGQPIEFADNDLRCPSGYSGGSGQGGRPGNAPWWGNSPPQGSYQQSCRNVRFQGGDLLTAECRRQNGNYRQTRLDIDSCRGRDIRNDNGNLECGGRFYENSYGRYQVPSGSWSQSCRNARIVRDDLVAECRQRDGDWQRTSLDLDDCRNRSVVNDNGRLRCDDGGRQGGDYRMPRGSWTQSCRSAEIRGDDLYAQCRGRDGRYHNTRIDLDRCPGRPLFNDNGELRCG